MDALLAKLKEHQTQSPKEPVGVDSVPAGNKDWETKAESSSSWAVMTPAGESPSDNGTQAKDDETIKVGKAEMLQLKKELEAARQQLELQKRELDQNRIFSHTLEQAMGSGEDVRASKLSSGNGNGNGNGNRNERTAKGQQEEQQTSMSTSTSTSIATSRSGIPRPDLTLPPDTSNTRAATHYNSSSQAQWPAASSPLNLSPTHPPFLQPMASWAQAGPATRTFNPRAVGQGLPSAAMLPPQPLPHQRILSGPPSPGTIGDGRFLNDGSQFQTGFGLRRNDPQIPRNDGFAQQQRANNSNNGWPLLGNGMGGLEAMSIGMNSNNTYQAMGMYQPAIPYQPRPIGTPLSATATEFRADEPPANPWNASVSRGSVVECLKTAPIADLAA